MLKSMLSHGEQTLEGGVCSNVNLGQETEFSLLQEFSVELLDLTGVDKMSWKGKISPKT